MALTILSLSFLGFLILGVPVAFAIGLSAVCTILYEGLPVAVVFQRMTSGMTVFSMEKSSISAPAMATGTWLSPSGMPSVGML